MLERIYTARRVALASVQTQTSLAEVKVRAMDAPPPRSFAAAIRKPDHISLIAEIKFRSPSAGALRPIEPMAHLAQGYEQGGADALSVLTEPEFFDGRLEYIEQAKDATRLPVLRKDFLFDPYQIYQSRAAQADAILLIAAMLSRNSIEELAVLSRELGMDVVLEVHDEEDLEKVSGIPVSMIGVNHRNLKTMKIDLEISRRLMPLISSNAVRVAESGIETAEQLALMRKRGADAALIGTSLMKSESPGAALQRLREAVCGLSSAVS